MSEDRSSNGQKSWLGKLTQAFAHEPKNRQEEAMLLHEGTKLEILDSISVQNDSTGLKWLDVQIDNNHRAWIKSSDIERI